MLSGRGLCDELITRPEESYRLWYVVLCDLENLVNVVTLAHWGAVAPEETGKRKIEHRAQKSHNPSVYRRTAARILLININSLLLRFQISRVRRYTLEYECTFMEQARFNPLS